MQRLRALLGGGGGRDEAAPHRKRSTDVDEAVSELAALVPSGASVSTARARTPRTSAAYWGGGTTADVPAGTPVTHLVVSPGIGCLQLACV